ncbi:MAG: APC family permease [Mycobacteriales bacterium]
MGLLDLPKRLFVGRPLSSEHLGHTLLPKKLALPVFSSDALSSVAYATEEIMLVLSLGGLAVLHYTPYVATFVALLLVIVAVSYRQTVRAYPQGGGAYRVAIDNLGETPGLLAASALLIDYVLTVAVSVVAGVAAVISAVPSIDQHRVLLCVGFVVFITLMNLRGVKESGTFFAIPTYGFIVCIYVLLAAGFYRVVTGGHLVAESANLHIEAKHSVLGLALVLLVLRAFAAGCTALTGVEAISDGVPAFKKPAAENAAATLLIMAVLSTTMFLGISVLAVVSHVRVTEDVHRTVVAQIAAAIFGEHNPFFFVIQGFTTGILILAANTAYQDFPRLSSILARDNYLPRQLYNRGDRLVFSNGIVMLALFASGLIWVFDARLTRIIQLYIVGVFVSFTLSQYGMVRRWSRLMREPGASRAQMRRSQTINAVGATATLVVLVIVLYSKFVHGAFIVVLTVPVLFAMMKGIHSHYARVAKELRLASTRPVLPARNHAVVLVSKLHNPTLKALNYAKSIKPHRLEALCVGVDNDEAAALQEEWERRDIDVPLKVVASPYREITKPVLDYIRHIRRESDRDVVTVIIPEYVVGKWWEQLLHNQSALRIKGALLFQPGVYVTSVPWHLSSAPDGEDVREDAATMPPGAPAVPMVGADREDG